MAYLIDGSGDKHLCRLLCDPGSQVSFITTRLFNQLAIPRHKFRVQVEGIGNTVHEYTRGRADIQMASISEPSFRISVNFHIITSITSPTPVTEVADHCWQHLRNLSLADHTFGKTGRIDALIGADIWGQLLKDGIVRGEVNEPIAQHTHLGWVVFGPATAIRNNSLAFQSMTLRMSEEDQRLDDLLRQIFNVDNNTNQDTDTVDYCERLFTQTHRQLQNGYYEVHMLFRAEAPALGSSHQLALRQFHQLERRLATDTELKQKYITFMREYEQLGHMHLVQDYHGDPSRVYYIPHHAVTRKFRVVFNASAKTTNGISLNDTQLAGPVTQDLLVNIIHRFRLFRVAITADVEKMFRQVRIQPAHQQWQQIFWRESVDQPIRTYQLATVTYGTTSGPYLAIRAMIQCGMDHCHKLLDEQRVSETRRSILNDFYVDDYLTSAPTAHQAIQLAQDVASVLQEGHFHLRKWKTNNAEVLARLSDQSENGEVNLQLAETTVLGLHWDSSTDELFYRVHFEEHTSNTKRKILSDASRLYDPTGMLAPIVVVVKLIIQKLWQAGLSWDEPVPPELLKEWLTFRNQLKQVENLRIPRWIGMSLTGSSCLYGFCDASAKAYAAVIYLSTKQKDGNHVTRIIAAKTKVAPIKPITIPRLELCAAQLLTNLMKEMRTNLHLEGLPYTLWSDSKIVLHWLNKNPSQLKQYVASRVAFIQEHSSVANWNHIRTQFNPADCASRGISPTALVSHSLWWQGPLPEQYPMTLLSTLTAEEAESIETEMKASKCKLAHVTSTFSLQTYYWKDGQRFEIPLVERFSNLGKLLRTTAILLRWKRIYRGNRHQPISAEEQEQALRWHIKAEQQQFFYPELLQLNKGKPISSSSRIITLAPFLDHTTGLLRVSGRLQNANISDEQRHPPILAKDSILTNLIIQQAHQDTLHGGIQLMIHTLRQKYWILHLRTRVKRCINLCAVCKRHRHNMATQRMASLPRTRVTPTPPFSVAGVDYCGPFSIRIGSKRVRTEKKTYVAIFICMATKAVHIELAEDLSSEAFINVFTRFTSRRGPCHELYSDNGTAFKGANRILAEDLQHWHDQYTQQQLANRGTQWHFIPPRAPHHGGLWEAAVKSAKKHLLRIVGNKSVYYDQLHTLLVHVEACLNSRPLVALHDSLDGQLALSPADFLIGRSIIAVPDKPLIDIPANRLSYWRQLRQMQQHFWRRWHNEYLCTLQQRSKWQSGNEDLKLNDIVLIRDENLPATHWRLGKIIALHPGRDGLVRVITIKHATGECTRPIQKVCKLLE